MESCSFLWFERSVPTCGGVNLVDFCGDVVGVVLFVFDVLVGLRLKILNPGMHFNEVCLSAVVCGCLGFWMVWGLGG